MLFISGSLETTRTNMWLGIRPRAVRCALEDRHNMKTEEGKRFLEKIFAALAEQCILIRLVLCLCCRNDRTAFCGTGYALGFLKRCAKSTAAEEGCPESFSPWTFQSTYKNWHARIIMYCMYDFARYQCCFYIPFILNSEYRHWFEILQKSIYNTGYPWQEQYGLGGFCQTGGEASQKRAFVWYGANNKACLQWGEIQ